MLRQWRSVYAVIASLCLCLGLAACGGTPSAAPQPARTTPAPKAAATSPAAGRGSSSTAKAALKAIRIGTPSLSDSLMPIFMAEKDGYYAQAGYAPALVHMAANASLAAVSAGEIEFVTPTDVAIPAASRGLPIRVVLSFLASPECALIVASDIHSASQLVGKAIAIDQPGTQTYYCAVGMLKQLGLKPNSVKLLDVATSGVVRMQALISGHVAGAIAAADATSKFPASKYRVLTTMGTSLAMPGYGLVTSEKLIQQHPAEVQALVTATLKGLRAFQTNKQAALAVLRSQLKTNAAGAAAMWQEFDQHMAPNGLMTLANTKAETVTNPSLKGKNPQQLLGATADMSFAQKAAAQIGS